MGDIAFILNVQHKQFMLSRGPYKSVKQDERGETTGSKIMFSLSSVILFWHY
jgi:hypothetical protein